MTEAPIAESLARIVGDAHVLCDPDVVAGAVVDWTGRFRGSTPAVVRPADAGEVARVVRWCASEGVALVPQGGNTGLVGGSVPLRGEVVLSLSRLSTLGDVDPLVAQVTVGAGATLEAVQQHVSSSSADTLEVAVDLAARGSATIGGMVATNAGGTRVLRHGPMRAQVVGVEAVLGTGAVVSHLGGLLKDNTGYDLASLLCGSEGTLAVVTAARLRLVATASARATALLAVNDVADAITCFVAARRGTSATLEAAELFLADGLALVCEHAGLAPPFEGGVVASAGAYLLLEVAGSSDPTDALVDALSLVDHLVIDTAVATARGPREVLWRYREAHTEAVNAVGVPHKLDVTLPLAQLAAFCDDVRTVVTSVAPDAHAYLFGHVGDGNVHVNVVGVEGGGIVPDSVDGAVLGLVAERGGSISAEHGIGTAKKAFLRLSRSAEEIDAFRAIKSALDPAGILNPNVLLPERDAD